MAGKFYFGAVPARAFRDRRLTLTHHLVIGNVAIHDRMSQGTQGQGCWASERTLAEEVGLNYSNFVTALNELKAWEYIHSEPLPQNRKYRVLRVIYTAEDEAVIRARKHSLPIGKSSSEKEEILCPPASDDAGIVCPPKQQVIGFIEGTPPNIFRRNGIKDISQKQKQIQHQAGPGESNPNGVLAQVGRRLRSPGLEEDELRQLRDLVTKICGDAEGGSETWGWAESLLVAIETRLAA